MHPCYVGQHINQRHKWEQYLEEWPLVKKHKSSEGQNHWLGALEVWNEDSQKKSFLFWYKNDFMLQ